MRRWATKAGSWVSMSTNFEADLFIWNWDVHFHDPNQNEQNDSRGHSTKKWDQVRQIQPSNVGYSSDSGNRSVETKELQRVNQLGWVGDSGGWNQFLLLSVFTNEDGSGFQNHGFSTTFYPRTPGYILLGSILFLQLNLTFPLQDMKHRILTLEAENKRLQAPALDENWCIAKLVIVGL